MKFSFSSEQDEFRSNLRRLLADRSPTTEVRRLMETDVGYDRDGWRAINDALGLTAIRIPEAYGGYGLSFGDQGIVLEEMGRALLCAPYFATAVLAAGAIVNAGTEAEKEALLPRVASGVTTATLAWVEDNGRWDTEGTALPATQEGGDFVLDGHKSYVIDGHTADLIVVLARAPQGLSLFTVDGNAIGLTRRALKSMDPTRKFARLEFSRVAAQPLGSPGEATAPFDRTITEATACLANEMVGGADRLREDARAYAMIRMQFGKPIASFQSMKHKHADMLLDVELAKSAAYYAAASLDEGDNDVAANAHLAKALASDAYIQTAIHAVQIHGGIGFTWDNDTHLWFKRAKSSEVLLGDAAYHRELMLQNWAA